MMPLHQERLDVTVFLKVMLLFLREALHHLLRSRSLAAVNNVMPGRNHGARGVVVSHPLSMREALGSIPSVSSLILSGSAPWAKIHIKKESAILEHNFHCLTISNVSSDINGWCVLAPSCPHFLLASNTSPPAASHAGVVTNTRLDFLMKNPTCKKSCKDLSLTSSKAKNVLLFKWTVCSSRSSEKRAYSIPWHLHQFLFSSWHLPKVLIRKSAIRACSGASTLKDQYLGQVPGGRKKKEEEKGRRAETRFLGAEAAGEVQEGHENRR